MSIPIIGKAIEQVKEINRMYKKPHIEITPFVKVCLFMLRVYLLGLVGLMVYKFLAVVNH